MLQVYGYPNAIYGANNYVGEPAAATAYLETPFQTALSSPRNIAMAPSGVVVTTDGELTGAATPVFGQGVPSSNVLPCDSGATVDMQSQNSIEAIKKAFVPFDCPCKNKHMTGGAAGVGSQFPDVPDSFWAACDIDKLAINDVVVGYPDGFFKPNRQISRAEFATMLVKGFNLTPECGSNAEFKDVKAHNWANGAISKAVDEKLMAGYPNKTFKPNSPVTRVEALSTIAKGMNCEMDECKANDILGQYSDGSSVPGWARIPVAKSLENGALKDMPNPNMIAPNKDASRAEVASMMQTVRVALGYDTNPATANDICPVAEGDKAAYIEHEEIVKVPTLQLSMIDQITAKSSHVGQYFRAKTLEEVTINGKSFPCGSIVSGQVVEVVRPSGCNKGALKLSFTKIQNSGCEEKLPKQIMQAQVNCPKQVNPVARIVEFPFTFVGSVLGIAGRTVGGALSNLGNAAENVVNDGGYMLGNIFQGELGASARSLGDGIVQTAMAPVNVVRTGLSGVLGLFETTGDEVAYLVNPAGYKISAVNPREKITIAFGCTD
jgi:hypothetical protein